MKTKGLDKVLRGHFQHCAIHQFSLVENRYCSCGIEKARVEKEILAKGFEWLLRAEEYISSFQVIEKNSLAHTELMEIIERAKNERIVSLK